MTSYTTGELFAIAIQVVIVLAVVRRSYAMARGVAYSTLRLAVLPGVILVLWVLSELESILLTPWALPYLILVDLLILVATVALFAPVAERATRVSRPPGEPGTYQIGFSIAALFLLAFVARLAVAVALYPGALVFGSPPGGYPPMNQQIVLAAFDAIFSFSVGLLIGRSLGIYRRWTHESSTPAAPSSQ